MEFATLEEARLDALRALTEIARDELPEDANGCEFTIHIREDDGPRILTARLLLEVKHEHEQRTNALKLTSTAMQN
jgi:hypothetical protein